MTTESDFDKGYEQGRRDERADIIAWLRAHGSIFDVIHWNRKGCSIPSRVAACIEESEHANARHGIRQRF